MDALIVVYLYSKNYWVWLWEGACRPACWQPPVFWAPFFVGRGCWRVRPAGAGYYEMTTWLQALRWTPRHLIEPCGTAGDMVPPLWGSAQMGSQSG